MGKMSKDKGKRFEREIASALKEYGYDTRRTSQYCGNTGDAADVIGLPGIHIECKHQEKVAIYDFMEQAIHDSAASGNKPTVFFRKNNHETLVCMRFTDWIDLYREWESGHDLECEEPEKYGDYYVFEYFKVLVYIEHGADKKCVGEEEFKDFPTDDEIIWSVLKHQGSYAEIAKILVPQKGPYIETCSGE